MVEVASNGFRVQEGFLRATTPASESLKSKHENEVTIQMDFASRDFPDRHPELHITATAADQPVHSPKPTHRRRTRVLFSEVPVRQNALALQHLTKIPV
jgi:hypothetical protein